MKMKMDLSRFKLKHRDDKSATLIHPDGHEFKLAVNALHPMNRKNLDSLEIHKPEAPKMAEGGEAEEHQPDSDERYKVGSLGELPAPPGADENEAEKQAILNQHAPKIKSLSKRAFAEGGEADSSDAQDSSSPEQPPVTVNVNSNPQGLNPQQVTALGGNENQIPRQEEPQQASPANKGLAQQPQVQVQGQPQQEPNTPDTMHGYQEQAKGIQGQAEAESQAAKEQEAALKGQAQGALNLKSQYDTHLDDLNQERQNLQQDIMNGHIDPNHFLGNQNAGQKVLTAVGLILGGMGGMGQGNQALDFLNRQIDRDIDTQKADLGKKENLLSANLRQFGNLKDATDMTRVMQHDAISAQLQAAAARSASPLAQARAQQMLGQLEQQTAPIVQTLAMRKVLTGGQAAGDGSLKGQDPAAFVPMVVPKEHQKQVFHEIAQAQNAAQNEKGLLEDFDKAAKENTVTGRLGRLGFNPPSILSMRATMLPIIHDAEGRVNEFEQKTTSDLEPKPGDTRDTVARKREGLKKFLHGKTSAPTAKGFGIDLGKFSSTSDSPNELNLNPQQKSYADWAKKNPQDPRSAMILKKLGI